MGRNERTDITEKKTACEGLFHVHSSFSSDGKLDLDELKAECLARGFSFMVVTDHAEDFGAGDLDRYVRRCRDLSGPDFLAVPGLEFRLPGNEEIHLLVAGWEGRFNGPQGIGNIPDILARAISAHNGSLVILAHPFKSATGCFIPPEIEPALDGLEIWNASCDSRYLPDFRALRTYQEFNSRQAGIIGIGGLDLHDRSGFRGVRIRLQGQCSGAADLIGRIRAGQFVTAGTCFRVPSMPEYGKAALALLAAGRRVLDAVDLPASMMKRLAGRTGHG